MSNITVGVKEWEDLELRAERAEARVKELERERDEIKQTALHRWDVIKEQKQRIKESEWEIQRLLSEIVSLRGEER